MKVRAFSIIELMVVIAIVGLLASVAVPSYRAYTARAKFTEIFKVARVAQKEIEEFHTRKARFPNNATEVNYPTSSSLSINIAGLSFIGCAQSQQDRFSVLLTDNISGETGQSLVFQASLENDVIVWRCTKDGNSTIIGSYLPNACDQDDSTWPACS